LALRVTMILAGVSVNAGVGERVAVAVGSGVAVVARAVWLTAWRRSAWAVIVNSRLASFSEFSADTPQADRASTVSSVLWIRNLLFIVLLEIEIALFASAGLLQGAA
jgi:hypothetical protein